MGSGQDGSGERAPITTAEELVSAWQDRVYSFVRRTVGQDADAGDLTQEVLITACRKLPSYDPSRPIGPWIYGIAAKRVLRFLRDRGRRQQRVAIVSPEGLSPAAAEERDSMDAAETQALVRDEVAGLPEELRLPIVLHAMQGQSIAAVGEALGVAKSTIQSRLERAREQLRQRLQRLVAPSVAAGLLADLDGTLAAMPMESAPANTAAAVHAALATTTTATAGATAAMVGLPAVATLGIGLAIGLVIASPSASTPAAGAGPDPTPPAVADAGSDADENTALDGDDIVTTTTSDATATDAALPRLTSLILAATDTEASAAFYTAVFGATFERQPFTEAFVAYVGTLAGIETRIFPAEMVGIAADQNRHQLGFMVPDVRAAIEAGLASGGSVDADWGVTRTPAGYDHGAIRDPDGNSIELFSLAKDGDGGE